MLCRSLVSVPACTSAFVLKGISLPFVEFEIARSRATAPSRLLIECDKTKSTEYANNNENPWMSVSVALA